PAARAEKAVEGYRSPRRFAHHRAAGKSARSWSAPVLWRFGIGRGMVDGQNQPAVGRCLGIGSASGGDLRDSRLPFARTFLSYAHLNNVEKLKPKMTSAYYGRVF